MLFTQDLVQFSGIMAELAKKRASCCFVVSKVTCGQLPTATPIPIAHKVLKIILQLALELSHICTTSFTRSRASSSERPSSMQLESDRLAHIRKPLIVLLVSVLA